MNKENEKIFNNFMNSATSSQLNSLDEDNGIATLGLFMAMPDELFDILSETFLISLEDKLKEEENILALKTALKADGIDINKFNSNDMEDLLNSFEKFFGNDLPPSRIEFLKRVVIIIYNTILDTIPLNIDKVSIPIEICNKDAKIPVYANKTDAGLDVYATEDITINPGETVLIKTGIKVAIPIGYEIQVRPKSGISLKTKLRVANTPGTIDSGYRDEIGIIIENIESPIQDISYHFENYEIIIDSILHGKPYYIEKGQKIAQLVVTKISNASFYRVDNIKEIEGDRGGGFGSTGLK